MKPDSPLKSKSVFPILVGAVVLALAAVTGFVAHTLFQSQQRYFDEADNASRNLSGALDNALQSHFQEVDLTLQRAPRILRHARRGALYRRGLQRLPAHAQGTHAAGGVDPGRGRQRHGRVWRGRSIRPNRWT
ncbi:hypothetical protein LP420_35940 [Massilia sp. B-10]|nr:hypothetical protein LP420_35940 [Massilia sp. B-10]